MKGHINNYELSVGKIEIIDYHQQYKIGGGSLAVLHLLPTSHGQSL